MRVAACFLLVIAVASFSEAIRLENLNFVSSFAPLASSCNASSLGLRLPYGDSGISAWRCQLSGHAEFVWERNTSFFSDRGPIAIVTLMASQEVEAYNDVETYEAVAKLSIPVFASYAQMWGYQFLVHNHSAGPASMKKQTSKSGEPVKKRSFHVHSNGLQDDVDDIDSLRVQPYWRKIDALRAALSRKPSPSWVLYSDVDVLLLSPEEPLEQFILGHEDKLLIGVGECTSLDAVRSGFFLLRNDNRTLQFLDDWQSRFMTFVHAENPDQVALEDVVSSPQWRDSVFLHDWRTFHSYDVCPEWMTSFSVHFPGGLKVLRVARTFLWQRLVSFGPANLDLSSREALSILRKGLPRATISQSTLEASRQCFERVNLGASPIAAELGLVCDPHYSTNLRRIERVVHLPEALVNKWFPLNKQALLIYSYSDRDMHSLVQSFFNFNLPWSTWSSRLPAALRLDLWKFTTLYLIGGFVVTDPNDTAVDLMTWGVRLSDQLVMGPLFSSAMAAMPLNPVVAFALQEARNRLRLFLYGSSSHEQDLEVVSSLLGGAEFQENLRKFTCYGDACGLQATDRALVRRSDDFSQSRDDPFCNISCPTVPIVATATTSSPCFARVPLCATCLTGQTGNFIISLNGVQQSRAVNDLSALELATNVSDFIQQRQAPCLSAEFPLGRTNVKICYGLECCEFTVIVRPNRLRPCPASPCPGCRTLTNFCAYGNTTRLCGIGGFRCQRCLNGDVCVLGECQAPAPPTMKSPTAAPSKAPTKAPTGAPTRAPTTTAPTPSCDCIVTAGSNSSQVLNCVQRSNAAVGNLCGINGGRCITCNSGRCNWNSGQCVI